MAARSIASLTVTFGLVSVPVKLFSATQSSAGISFNLLHQACGSRLKQQYICAKENVVVERADMIKGYEFAKDQYVTFTPDELKQLEEKGSQSIEIVASFARSAASGALPILRHRPLSGSKRQSHCGHATGMDATISIDWLPFSSSCFNSSGVNVTYWSLANS